MSEIESLSALNHFDEILEESDGISEFWCLASCPRVDRTPFSDSYLVDSSLIWRGNSDPAGHERAEGDGRSLQHSGKQVIVAAQMVSATLLVLHVPYALCEALLSLANGSNSGISAVSRLHKLYVHCTNVQATGA